MIIKFILKVPILKRLIPSLSIRILKIFNKNKGYYDIVINSSFAKLVDDDGFELIFTDNFILLLDLLIELN